MRHPIQFQGCLDAVEYQILNAQGETSRPQSHTSVCSRPRQRGQVSLWHSSESEGLEHPLEAEDALETDDALDTDEALDAEFDEPDEPPEPPEPPLARATLSVVNDGAA